MKNITLLFLLIILTWCSINSNNEKANEISLLEKEVSLLKKEIENDLFIKNKECSNYYEKIKENEEEYIYEKNHSDIEWVFYSKEYNSCLYAVHRFDTKYGDNWFIINNFLTKELVYTSWLVNVTKQTDLYYKSEKEWKDKIENLK